MRLARSLALGAAATGAAVWWWRTHPSPCPYGQRWVVEVPHPMITRARLLEALRPQAGERMLELGPGTGYYTLEVAEHLEPGGTLELLDVQPEMLEHTMAAAGRRGLGNLRPQVGDAQSLPYEDDGFDAAFMVTVLGEVPDGDAALRELRRVVRPGGRLVVGEVFFDPHFVPPRALRRRAGSAGFAWERQVGSALGYFAVVS